MVSLLALSVVDHQTDDLPHSRPANWPLHHQWSTTLKASKLTITPQMIYHTQGKQTDHYTTNDLPLMGNDCHKKIFWSFIYKSFFSWNKQFWEINKAKNSLNIHSIVNHHTYTTEDLSYPQVRSQPTPLSSNKHIVILSLTSQYRC
jgi:hypothetical protein